MNVKTVETERLILRPLTILDADDVFEWTSDPVVNRYMPYPLHERVYQTEEWIRTLSDNEFCFCLKESEKVIGSGSINYKEKYGAYELGYNLNRLFWGKGYATEASKAMIQWAYQTLNAREFLACHANANKASENVIKKCGFQFEQYGLLAKYDGSETFEASYYRLHL